jgi:protocatechuate 3,4-dioxygenase beta subunit
MKTALSVTLIALLAAASIAGAVRCPPTEPDEVGPFYRPNAPLRFKIGTGYLLTGTVRSTADCRTIPKARIEVWHAGPGGEYDEAHRATLYSDAGGNYRLETHFPPPYLTRPSHIHFLVEAPGFERLITQHYPKQGSRAATFDFVLIPGR